MKRWAVIIALFYGVIILLLSWPVTELAFLFFEGGIHAHEMFFSWTYWIILLVLILSQYLLLAVPVDLQNKRPVTKKPLVMQVAATGLMMGLLGAGLVVSFGEFFFQ